MGNNHIFRHIKQLRIAASVALVGFFSATAIISSQNVSALPTYQSLFQPTQTPAVLAASDSNSVELGVKFTASSKGSIAGIKFYKSTTNTGTHTGSLWDAYGKRLATVTFTNETASGWQTAMFSAPVSIYNGETYTATYLAPVGHYAYTQNFFAQAYSNGSALTAPSGGSTSTNNGVFKYGSTGGFPTAGSQSSNYWVDVLYSTANKPPAVPPAPYVKPGTQGYKGSTLPVYSAANGLLPAPNCRWQADMQLRCEDTDLTLANVYIKGGVYWTGCGNLNISNSIIDWKPTTSQFNVRAACQTPNPGSTLTIAHTTLRTAVDKSPYNFIGSDISPMSDTGARPLLVSNSVAQSFPLGFQPGPNSSVKNNEIYAKDNSCPTQTNPNEPCHISGINSAGGSNIVIDGNYIVAPSSPTSTGAVFFQGPPSTNNTVRNNFLKGGSITLVNQTSSSMIVQNNTFSGWVNSHASLVGSGGCGTIATWTGNIKPNGFPLPPPVPCS